MVIKLNKYKAIIITLILSILLPMLAIPNTANAKGVTANGQEFADNYTLCHANVNADDAKALYSLKIQDSIVPTRLISWIHNNKSFCVQDNTTKMIYFNMPNVQQIIFDEVGAMVPQGLVTIGGGSNKGPNYNATNLYDREGFDIPSYLYFGEKPYINISLGDLLNDDSSFWGNVGKWFKTIFTGEIVSPPDSKDMKSIYYKAPMDYTSDSSIFFGQFLTDNYDKLKKIVNKDKKSNKKKCLIKSADENCTIDGNSYLLQDIFTDDVMNNLQAHPTQTVKSLMSKLGDSYNSVAGSTIAYISGGRHPMANNRRVMPYDKSTMIDGDNKWFVDDPRGNYNPVLSLLYYIPQSIILNVTKFFDQIAVWLYQHVSLSYLLNNVMDFKTAWGSSMFLIIANIFAIGLVIIVARRIFKYMKGGGSVRAIFSISFVGLLVIALFTYILTPAGTAVVTDRVKQAVALPGKIVGNSNITSKQMCNGDMSCMYYLAYADAYTQTFTGAPLSSPRNNIDLVNDKAAEVQGVTDITIGNNTVNNWGVLLMDAARNNDRGTMLRVVDHYMAPRSDPKSSTITYRANGNMIGLGIQRYVPISAIFNGILMFILSLISCLLLIDMYFDTLMLPIEASIATLGGGFAKSDGTSITMTKVLKTWGMSFVKIGFWYLYQYIVFYMLYSGWQDKTNSGSQWAEMVITILDALFIYLIVQMCKFAIKSELWCPRVLSMIQIAITKLLSANNKLNNFVNNFSKSKSSKNKKDKDDEDDEDAEDDENKDNNEDDNKDKEELEEDNESNSNNSDNEDSNKPERIEENNSDNDNEYDKSLSNRDNNDEDENKDDEDDREKETRNE